MTNISLPYMRHITMFIHGENTRNRGVAITVDYILGLGVVLVLSGVLLGGVYTVQDDRQQAVEQQEVERVNETVVAELQGAVTLAETLNETGDEQNASILVTTDDAFVGDTVSVSIAPNGTTALDVIVQSDNVVRRSTIRVEDSPAITGVASGMHTVSTSTTFVIHYNTNGANEVNVTQR